MKKYLKFTFIGLMIFLLGIGIRKLDFFNNHPEITILNSSFKDFGTLSKGDDAFFYFKYKNTGTSELKIINVETKCGCTIPEWNKEFIQPHKIDSIKVVYDTSIIGPFNRSIIIHSNALNSVKYLYVKGIVMD